LHTHIRSRNCSLGEYTAFGAVTRVVLTLISVVGDTIRNGMCNYTSSRVASILITHIGGRYRVLCGNAALGRIASVRVAKISLVGAAYVCRERGVYTKILGRIGRVYTASIGGTQNFVITRSHVGGGTKNAGHKEGGLDGTSR